MSSSQPFMFRCPSCRAKNRIPQDKVGLTAKCGKCAAALDTRQLQSPQPVMVTDANFQTMVLESPLPVLLDCWATWCSACATLSPTIQELAAEWKGRVRVAKLNVEANPMLTARYDLRSLPTLLIFDGAQLRDSMFGAFPKAHIVSRMAPYL